MYHESQNMGVEIAAAANPDINIQTEGNIDLRSKTRNNHKENANDRKRNTV